MNAEHEAKIYFVETCPLHPIFPNGAPAKSPAARYAQLGDGRELVYLLDLERVTPEQRDQVIIAVAEFHRVSSDEVAAGIGSTLPVRLNQTRMAPPISLRSFI